MLFPQRAPFDIGEVGRSAALEPRANRMDRHRNRLDPDRRARLHALQ
jgi:hypothetical protein